MGKNIDYMMEMVEDYLEGNKDRMDFELDFQYEIIEKYRKMAKEDGEFAEYFYDMLVEEGVDAGKELTDEKFFKLIRKNFSQLKGFYSVDIL